MNIFKIAITMASIVMITGCASGLNSAVSKAECNTVNESTLGHYHSAPALLA